MIDLSKEFNERFNSYPRTIGRYHVSELWAIQNGYLTPRTFFSQKSPTIAQASGIWKHRMIQELLAMKGYEIEPKREYAYGGITIVGKADALLENYGLEIKTTTSFSIIARAMPSHITQAKSLASLFERPLWVVVQPTVENNNLRLAKLAQVERDDKWFAEVLSDLLVFHNSVINYVAAHPMATVTP